MVQHDKNSLVVVGVGIALGVVGMVLTFWGQMGSAGTVGIGMTLFLLAWMVVVIIHAQKQGITPQKRTLLLMVPMIFSALMIALRADGTLGSLNVATFLAAGLLFVYFFGGGNLLATSLWAYGIDLISSGVEAMFRPFAEGLNSLKWIADRRGQWQKLMPVVRGLAITTPIVAVFVMLFGSADAVFGKYLQDLMNLFNFSALDGLAFRVGYAGVVGWLTIGTLGVSLADHSEKRKRPPITQPHAQPEQAESTEQTEKGKADYLNAQAEVAANAPLFRLGLIETSMVLGGVCAVFLLFVIVQGVYLFGGVNNIANFSYAEYTHRGFAELVVIAVLSLGLIYTIKGVTGIVETQQSKIFRGLATALMVLTGIVLVSAFQRLRLYEITYGFTSLRLTIYITIVWLGVLLVGMSASLFWLPRNIKVFETAVLIAVFGFSITHSVINPDWFVAQQNINRGDIDPVYLSRLSAEATPALIPLLDSPDIGTRVIVAKYLSSLQNTLTWKTADWRVATLSDYNLRGQLSDSALSDKIAKIVRDEAPHLLDRKHIDDDLKLGMSVREVTRQFGAPLWASSSDERMEDTTSVYSLTYYIGNDQFSLYFDTAKGLTQAELCNQKQVCQTIKG